MIKLKSKAQFIRALKENKENVTITTLEHFRNLQVGTTRAVGTVQSNAFTLITTKEDGQVFESWLYFAEIVVVDGLLHGKHNTETEKLIWQVNINE